jgi:amino acid transporter
MTIMIEEIKLNEKFGLKKSINLFSGVTISIGVIVGSGIFITPSSVLQNAGSPGLSLCIWLFAGLISLIGAICFTELGTFIEKPGGVYAYINEAYGHLMAFLYIWMMLVVCLPSLNAVSALTISMYLVQLFFNDCVAPVIVTKIIAALIICK